VSELFAVAICTRERPEQVARALDELLAQDRPFPILVVDQSPDEDAVLARRAADAPELTVLRDSGRGLSRARNVAWRHLDAEWVVFVDDDCLVEPGWADALAEEMDAHPEVSFISGHVGAHQAPEGDYAPVTIHSVSEPQLLGGARLRPWAIGFGVCMAIRRSTIAALDGWDERLGPGCRRYPAADDMDFNYRLLRSGATAYLTPRVRVLHEQWRRVSDLPALYEGYMTAWTGFSIKHLRTGDLLGGARLWWHGVLDFARMLASAVRRRSPWRAKLAAHKLRGLVIGTARGLSEHW
jgi:O-antigen biosynthesis protein